MHKPEEFAREVAALRRRISELSAAVPQRVHVPANLFVHHRTRFPRVDDVLDVERFRGGWTRRRSGAAGSTSVTVPDTAVPVRYHARWLETDTVSPVMYDE